MFTAPSTRSPAGKASKRALVGAAALSLALGSVGWGSTSAVAGGGHHQPPGHHDPRGQLVELQLLAFNDYHGHLEANTPGTLDGAPAGGSQYLAAKLNELRAGHKHSLTVAAGDLIGGSPAFPGCSTTSRPSSRSTR